MPDYVFRWAAAPRVLHSSASSVQDTLQGDHSDRRMCRSDGSVDPSVGAGGAGEHGHSDGVRFREHQRCAAEKVPAQPAAAVSVSVHALPPFQRRSDLLHAHDIASQCELGAPLRVVFHW